MAVSSLTRFTVPLSGNQSASTQGLLMPKLKFRFRVSFDNFGVSTPKTELTKQVMSFARPQVTFDPIEIPVYNSRVYLAGRPTWQAVSTTLRDDAGGNISRLVGEQLQKQYDFMEQASASSGIDYKFITRLEMLDGANGNIEPIVLETWELYGCFLTDVNYNDVDYGSNDPVTVTMSIRYDNAIQTSTPGGVGNDVGRTNGTVITG
tara:strand:+ start:6354 stop:6971 length:618 start_codon:yes stop_codon:yes gene_type:complete